MTENPTVQIYVKRIKNRIVFKIKAVDQLNLLTPETIKILGSIEKDIDKNKDGEDVPKVKFDEVALVCCNLMKSFIFFSPK